MTFAFYELAARREVRMSNPLHQAPSVESEGGSVMAKLHPLAQLWARDSFDGFDVAAPWHATHNAFLTSVARDKVRFED